MDQDLRKRERRLAADPSNKTEALQLLRQAQRGGGLHSLDQSLLNRSVALLDPSFFWESEAIDFLDVIGASSRSNWPAEFYLSQSQRAIRFFDQNLLEFCLKAYGGCLRRVLIRQTFCEAMADLLSQCPGLESLELDFIENMGPELMSVAGLSELKTLRLGSGAVRFPNGLRPLAGLDKLQSLEMMTPGGSDDNFQGLEQLPRLRSLKMSSLNVKDQDLEALRQCPQLETFESYICHQLTDRSLKLLSELPSLKALTIGNSGQSGFSSGGLRALTNLKGLEHLSMKSFDKLSPAEFEDIFYDHKQLQSLNFRSCPGLFPSGFYRRFVRKPSILDWLSRQGRVKRLSLQTKFLDSTSWKQLGLIKLLENLRLVGEVSNRNFRDLAQLNNLKHLEILSPTSLEYFVFHTLAQLSSLTTLEIEYCKLLNTEGLALLSSCPKLKQLTLHFCNLEEADISPVLKSSSLELLKVPRCQGVTKESLKRLAKSAPDVVIVSDQFDSRVH